MRFPRLVCLALVLTPTIGCSYDSPGPGPDDPPTIGFEFAASGADEQSGTVMLPVVLSKPSVDTVTVKYSVLGGGTATPADDFVVDATMLTFAPGETRAEIPVEIKSDFDDTEAAETFDIGLAAPEGAELDPNRAIHEVKIADHILPRINFATASVDTQTSEDSPTTLTLTLTAPSEGESTIVIGVAGGATDPVDTEDLTLTEGTIVTIPDGATSVDVPVGDVNDALDEHDETAVFELKGASQNMVLGMTKIANHTILDDDPTPTLSFTVASSSVNEDGATATISVSLSAESGLPVTVDFASDLTSTAAGGGTDFSLPATTTLTFNPHTPTTTGDTTKTFDVTIVNDVLDEDAETVVLDLSNAVNATLANPMQHTLTINADANDPAPSAAFAMASRTVSEKNAGTIQISVTLSGASGKQVSVPFSVNGGMTTTDGADLTINTSSPLTFAPGDTSKDISITINNNSPGNEPDELLVLDIGTPTNASVGTNARFTLTVTEN